MSEGALAREVESAVSPPPRVARQSDLCHMAAIFGVYGQSGSQEVQVRRWMAQVPVEVFLLEESRPFVDHCPDKIKTADFSSIGYSAYLKINIHGFLHVQSELQATFRR